MAGGGGRVGARRPFCEVIYLQATALTSPAPSGSCSLVTVSPSCLLPPMLSGACVSQGRDEGSPHTHTRTHRGTWTSNRMPIGGHACRHTCPQWHMSVHMRSRIRHARPHTHTQTDEGNQKPCAQRPINLHTHTRPYTDHTCARTHIVADECSHTHSATHSHTFTHAVCVCVQKLVQPPWQMIVHMHAHSHMYTHARRHTHLGSRE